MARLFFLLVVSAASTFTTSRPVADAQSAFIPPGRHFALCTTSFRLPDLDASSAVAPRAGPPKRRYFNHVTANISQDFPKSRGGQMQVWTMSYDAYNTRFLDDGTKDAAVSEAYAPPGSCPRLVQRCLLNSTIDATEDACIVVSSNLPNDTLSILYTIAFEVLKDLRVRREFDNLSEGQIILITAAASFGLLVFTVLPFAIYEKLRFRSEKLKLKDRIAAAATAAKSMGIGQLRGSDRGPAVQRSANGYNPLPEHRSPAMELQECARPVS